MANDLECYRKTRNEGEYKREEVAKGILEHPIILYIHLTSKCNLKCPYCYNQEHRTELIGIGRTPGGGVIATEGKTKDFLRVVDEAAELGFREVKLTGGEALIDKDALLIAERAKSHGMRVNLLTNGLLVTEEMAQKIARFVDSVSSAWTATSLRSTMPCAAKGLTPRWSRPSAG